MLGINKVATHIGSAEAEHPIGGKHRLRWVFLFILLTPGLFGFLPPAPSIERSYGDCVSVTSPDGLLTLMWKAETRVIVAEEGLPPAKPRSETDCRNHVERLAVSGDKSVYATLTSNYRVDVVRRGWPEKVLASIKRDEIVRSVAVAPDGSSAAIGTETEVLILSCKTGRASPITQTPKGTRAVCYSPDGTQLAVGDGDGHVRVMSMKTRKVLWEQRPHQEQVRTLAFSADGKTLASGGEDETIRLSRASDGQRIRHIHAHRRSVSAVALSPDGSLVGSVGLDQLVTVWDVAKGKQLFFRKLLLPEILSSVALTKDSKLVIASGEFRGVLDARTGKTLYSNGKLDKRKDEKEAKPK